MGKAPETVRGISSCNKFSTFSGVEDCTLFVITFLFSGVVDCTLFVITFLFLGVEDCTLFVITFLLWEEEGLLLVLSQIWINN